MSPPRGGHNNCLSYKKLQHFCSFMSVIVVSIFLIIFAVIFHSLVGIALNFHGLFLDCLTVRVVSVGSVVLKQSIFHCLP